MRNARKKIFIAIMLCFVLQVILLGIGIMFIMKDDKQVGIIWILAAVTGFLVNLQNLKKNRKYKKNGKFRFKE